VLGTVEQIGAEQALKQLHADGAEALVGQGCKGFHGNPESPAGVQQLRHRNPAVLHSAELDEHVRIRDTLQRNVEHARAVEPAEELFEHLLELHNRPRVLCRGEPAPQDAVVEAQRQGAGAETVQHRPKLLQRSPFSGCIR
jgi:hypothetical protein